ncbi:hypothetical protein PIROE2DRAFT_20740 [Piromyces sp. E2]|nr:hypothetical protein PIROE2DRAFT_20740 [Piromyces sp. E2]|eukprot:OUM62872.1 hypothetical protein PIROE2DRAFT_20740 [Piromyces sp. E2]
MALSPFLTVYLIACAVTALGFVKFAYFMSLGYAFTESAIGLALIVMYKKQLTMASALLCLCLIIYGVRLGSYLIIRKKRASFNEKMKKEGRNEDKKLGMGVMISTWLSCALLYLWEASPVLFRLQNGKGDDLLAYLGVIICIVGLVFEGLGDHQKYEAKKKEPTRFVNTGLYSVVRCPNYFGEILMWTGIFVSGFTACQGVWQWISAIVGYICIVGVMYGAAMSIEKSHNKNYDEDEKYQDYVKKTPIIIPFVPLYHLVK